MSLVIRWQIGDFGPVSWRSLNLSIALMQKLEPDATYVVVHQGQLRQAMPRVLYYKQDAALYSHGRFERPFADIVAPSHEVTMENDHILWALSPAWRRWRAREDAVLAWIVDWDYYDKYDVTGFWACPGMYGLPPGLVMPPPPAEEWGNDQAEQGYVAHWLREHGPHEIVTHEEVSAYMPNHEILKHTHSKVGLYGVHLPGLNRGWSACGEALLDEIERRWL